MIITWYAYIIPEYANCRPRKYTNIAFYSNRSPSIINKSIDNIIANSMIFGKTLQNVYKQNTAINNWSICFTFIKRLGHIEKIKMLEVTTGWIFFSVRWRYLDKTYPSDVMTIKIYFYEKSFSRRGKRKIYLFNNLSVSIKCIWNMAVEKNFFFIMRHSVQTFI